MGVYHLLHFWGYWERCEYLPHYLIEEIPKNKLLTKIKNLCISTEIGLITPKSCEEVTLALLAYPDICTGGYIEDMGFLIEDVDYTELIEQVCGENMNIVTKCVETPKMINSLFGKVRKQLEGEIDNKQLMEDLTKHIEKLNEEKKENTSS